MPSEYGIQRKWYFLCAPSYWCNDGSQEISDAGPTNSGPPPLALEAVPEPVTTRNRCCIRPPARSVPIPLHLPLWSRPSQRFRCRCGMCMRSAWCDRSSAALRAGGVKTVGLRKVWNKQFVAVHGLDLEMAPGQITGLLGANGAGKTTTISMLTGLITPTAGDASIDGKSIGTAASMQQIRLSLGVCPQVRPV